MAVDRTVINSIIFHRGKWQPIRMEKADCVPIYHCFIGDNPYFFQVGYNYGKIKCEKLDQEALDQLEFILIDVWGAVKAY